MRELVEMVRRLAGDTPDANVPESLRSRGVIAEMRDEFRAEMRAQRAALLKAQRLQASRDAARDLRITEGFAKAETERAAIRTKVEATEAKVDSTALQVEALHRQHLITRGIIRMTGWLTVKDDKLTIAVLKISGLIGGVGLIGTALYHIGAYFLRIWAAHHLSVIR